MLTVPISEFEHRVAKWIAHMEKTREPLEVSQRGHAKLVVMDKTTFEELKDERERLRALEIKLLVEAGERDIAAGRLLTQEQVERMARQKPRRRRRKS